MYYTIVIILLMVNVLFAFYFKPKIKGDYRTKKEILIRNIIYYIFLVIGLNIAVLILYNKGVVVHQYSVLIFSSRTSEYINQTNYLYNMGAIELRINVLELAFDLALIPLIHLLIDYIERFMIKRNLFKLDYKSRYIKNFIFLVKEAIIVVSILLLFSWLNEYCHINIEKTVIAFVILLLLKPSSILIEDIIGKPINIEPTINEAIIAKDSLEIKKEEKSNISSSELLGYTERLLICLFIYINVYWAAAAVIALKVGLRFHKFKNKEETEYLLLGTMLSVLTAVSIYLVAMFIW